MGIEIGETFYGIRGKVEVCEVEGIQFHLSG